MRAVSSLALSTDLQGCLVRSSVRCLTSCLDSCWWLTNAKLLLYGDKGLTSVLPIFHNTVSYTKCPAQLLQKNSMQMTHLDLNHDPHKKNFCIHTFWCCIGPDILTRLGISLILIKREASRISVLGLVLLQTLNSFQCPFIAAQCQDLKIGFLSWGKAGLTLCPQAGDTY